MAAYALTLGLLLMPLSQQQQQSNNNNNMGYTRTGTKEESIMMTKRSSRYSKSDKQRKMPNEKRIIQESDVVAKTRTSNQDHPKLAEKEKKEEDDNNLFLLPRVLAFVFPQFHRDAINDRLWGDGFTDWDSLRKAPTRNRLGYAIPRPSATATDSDGLGFYNYTDRAPRQKQGQLAREYNLDGFVFHHYWFYDDDHPGPNLHAPLMEMLKDGEPNVPFALHWCASKWVSTWNGNVRADFYFKEPGVLQKQYFPKNASDPRILQHYQWLRQFFHHENYIKVHGNQPLFMIYQRKPGSFLVLEELSRLAQQDGFPDGLYLTVGLTMPHSHLQDIYFGNDNNNNNNDNNNDNVNVNNNVNNKKGFQLYKNKPQQINDKTRQHFDKVLAYPNPTDWNQNRPLKVPAWCSSKSSKHKRVNELAGIIAAFDNTPRRTLEEAHLWSAAEPAVVVERFRQSLHAALYYETCCFPNNDNDENDNDTKNRWKRKKNKNKKRRVVDDDDDRFVIINAMNEWAEGMALEPSDVFGHRFLEVIRDVKHELNSKRCSK